MHVCIYFIVIESFCSKRFSLIIYVLNRTTHRRLDGCTQAE